MDKNGDTALMLAAASNNTEMIRLLLKKGALINARNCYGQTALWLAVSANPWEDIHVSAACSNRVARCLRFVLLAHFALCKETCAQSDLPVLLTMPFSDRLCYRLAL